MGELEPDDSRDVTLTDRRAPGESERTGPREGETRGEKSQQQGQWRTDSQGQTQGQSQTNESNWRAAEAGREAQDHDKAGGIDAPSPSPRADDGQWSQQPADERPEQADPEQANKAEYPLGADRPGAEPRGARESMTSADDAERRDQAERGGS